MGKEETSLHNHTMYIMDETYEIRRYNDRTFRQIWEQLAEWWEPCATEPYVSCSILLKDFYFFKGSFMELENLIYMI
jgi:hypothetical protein